MNNVACKNMYSANEKAVKLMNIHEVIIIIILRLDEMRLVVIYTVLRLSLNIDYPIYTCVVVSKSGQILIQIIIYNINTILIYIYL